MMSNRLREALEKYKQDFAADTTLILEHTSFAVSSAVAFAEDWAHYHKMPYNDVLCDKLCTDRPECFGWHFADEGGCNLNIKGWNVPIPEPEKNVRAGIRLDRIAAFLDENDCYNPTLRRSRDESWI